MARQSGGGALSFAITKMWLASLREANSSNSRCSCRYARPASVLYLAKAALFTPPPARAAATACCAARTKGIHSAACPWRSAKQARRGPFAAKHGTEVVVVQAADRVVEQMLAGRHNGGIRRVSCRLLASRRPCVRGRGSASCWSLSCFLRPHASQATRCTDGGVQMELHRKQQMELHRKQHVRRRACDHTAQCACTLQKKHDRSKRRQQTADRGGALLMSPAAEGLILQGARLRDAFRAQVAAPPARLLSSPLLG